VKYIATLFLSLISFVGSAQSPYQQVTLTRKDNIQTKVSAVTNDVADKALRIASLLLSSKAFQDSISRLIFPASNYCRGYSNDGNRKDSITGRVILDMLYKKQRVSLNLIMEPVGKKPIYRKPPKENSCFGLGFTNPGSDIIHSYFENINCDMAAELPFAAAYGVHLSHEYLHDIGFCHNTNEVETDIAEAVGWIAYHFIKQWNGQHDPAYLDAIK